MLGPRNTINPAFALVARAGCANGVFHLLLCSSSAIFAISHAFPSIVARTSAALFNDDSCRQGNCSLDDHQHRQHQKCRANRHFFSDSACRLHTTVTNYYQLAVTAAALRVGCFQSLKWFCEAGVGVVGGSPDEPRLEQTPYPFQPH